MIFADTVESEVSEVENAEVQTVLSAMCGNASQPSGYLYKLISVTFANRGLNQWLATMRFSVSEKAVPKEKKAEFKRCLGLYVGFVGASTLSEVIAKANEAIETESVKLHPDKFANGKSK